jgi:CMP-N-acetylneuraminic acid synthetase|tara:strand:+ start:473 stop:1219 length:747 start_codon:yes stop_codon:yes gene_type:complete
MKKIVALIPSRSGSKRIPNKNIKILNGHPLIAYSIVSANNSGVFDEIIVSTDSEKYKEIAEHYGANVVIRPPKYAEDNSPDIEWVTYTLNDLKGRGKEYDLFSILRPTSPFRLPLTINRALNQFLKLKNVDSIRAVEVCAQHPAKMWFVKDSLMESVMAGCNSGVPWHSCQFSSLPVIYVQNASLEIAKTSNVLDKNSISGDKIAPFFTDSYEGFDLNQPYDWEYATYLIEQKLAKLPVIHTATSITK